MKQTKNVLLIISSFIFSGHLIADTNPPLIKLNPFNLGMKTNINELYLNENSISMDLPEHLTPWASTYWPSSYGGIAVRWTELETLNYPEKFKYKRNLNLVELSQISEDLKLALEDKFFETSEIPDELFEGNDPIIKEKIRKQELLSGPYQVAHYQNFFNYLRPNSKDQILRMSQSELDQLSPAEKYDIYVGNYGLALTFKALNDARKNMKDDWAGICNGWAQAAMTFAEPENKTVKNRDGITINFYSSDIKALASFYFDAVKRDMFLSKTQSGSSVGKKCNITIPEDYWSIDLETGIEYYQLTAKSPKKIVPADCKDVNAGAFHITLANFINFKKKSFAFDIVRDREVWNQPVVGYDSTYEEQGHVKKYATIGTKKQVLVKTQMRYADDGGMEYWKNSIHGEEFYVWKNPTNGTPDYRFETADLEYLLDLDGQNNIIGGTWISYERPDFLWIKKTSRFLGPTKRWPGYLSSLQNLVSPL